MLSRFWGVVFSHSLLDICEQREQHDISRLSIAACRVRQLEQRLVVVLAAVTEQARLRRSSWCWPDAA